MTQGGWGEMSYEFGPKRQKMGPKLRAKMIRGPKRPWCVSVNRDTA